MSPSLKELFEKGLEVGNKIRTPESKLEGIVVDIRPDTIYGGQLIEVQPPISGTWIKEEGHRAEIFRTDGIGSRKIDLELIEERE